MPIKDQISNQKITQINPLPSLASPPRCPRQHPNPFQTNLEPIQTTNCHSSLPSKPLFPDFSTPITPSKTLPPHHFSTAILHSQISNRSLPNHSPSWHRLQKRTHPNLPTPSNFPYPPSLFLHQTPSPPRSSLPTHIPGTPQPLPKQIPTIYN